MVISHLLQIPMKETTFSKRTLLHEHIVSQKNIIKEKGDYMEDLYVSKHFLFFLENSKCASQNWISHI